MRGGVGRYTSNLVNALIKKGVEVSIVCHQDGSGDFNILKFYDQNISDLLLRAIQDCKPDVVHLQHEFQLYDKDVLHGTNLRRFYSECKIPIVTTFHSVWSWHEWRRAHSLLKKHGRIGKLGIPLRAVMRAINIRKAIKGQRNILHQLSSMSSEVINLSDTSRKILNAGSVIYHGAECRTGLDKYECRKSWGLPPDKMLALAFGFNQSSKGWEILDRLTLPKDWQIVINYAEDPFSAETNTTTFNNIINLNRDYLNEEELSQLLVACDALLLPYKLVSCSGVMFDGLGHGLPFIASDLFFFNEFASLRLGITADRHPDSFSNALKSMDENYDAYKAKVEEFSHRLNWVDITEAHLGIYHKVLNT